MGHKVDDDKELDDRVDFAVKVLGDNEDDKFAEGFLVIVADTKELFFIDMEDFVDDIMAKKMGASEQRIRDKIYLEPKVLSVS